MSNTFFAGLKLKHNKELTEKLIIGSMPSPSRVKIPLSQHIGKAAQPVVKVGDSVAAGQLIGRADGVISANVFSSISGKVTEISEHSTSYGLCDHITIESDGQDKSVTLEPMTEDAEPADLVQRMHDCGIVGMGGAGFPLAVKLKPKSRINTYIINGTECEPYITCDHRIMLDYTEQLIKGALILARCVGLDTVTIAIEDNKPDAIELLSSFAKRCELNVNVVPLKTKYPQGAEKQLIYSVTKRKVPVGGLPADVGVLVSNVHTALSAYYAVVKGIPSYKRVMTVTGSGVQSPANLWVYTGTSLSEVLEFCGGMSDIDFVKIISGGPMMGGAIESLDYFTAKITSCMLLLSDEETYTENPSQCINCGKCVKVCPMKLMPMYIVRYITIGDVTNAVKYGAKSCIDCGCCSYVCPAKIPLVQSVRLAKKKDAERYAK